MIDQVKINTGASESPNNQLLILVTLAIGFVMATLDITIVNVALPTISGRFNLDSSQTTWIVDSYTLAFSSLLFLGASIANKIGPRGCYSLGLIIFILGSIGCGISTNGNFLIIARFIQGFGSALFMPSSLNLLSSSFTDTQTKSRMIGLWAGTVSIATALGPVLGGGLVHFFGWRSIFIVNIPVGICGLVMLYRYIENFPVVKSEITLDNLFLFFMLMGLTVYIINGAKWGWLDKYSLAMLAIAILFAVMFMLYQRYSQNNIIPRELYQHRRFALLNCVAFFLNLSLFGMIFMLTIYMQSYYHLSPLYVGLSMMPIMSVFGIANIVFSFVIKYFNVSLILPLSMSASFLFLIPILYYSADINIYIFLALITLSNVGVGFAVPAMTTQIMQIAGNEYGNIAAAIINVSRQIGSLIGIALVGLTITAFIDWELIVFYSFLLFTLSYIAGAFFSFYVLHKEAGK